MFFHPSRLVAYFALLSGVTVLAAAAAPSVLLPSQDPFYTQPDNIASYAPGQVIDTRIVSSDLNSILGPIDPNIPINVKTTYQYLYRTTDSLGDAVAAVTTLLVPHNADTTKLLAYQNVYDAANINCSPSYGIQAGANTSAVADMIMITAALNNGWYVMTPDYEGLNAQFIAGLQSGYATLDSVRVALNTASSTGLSSSARYAMWGYSGGSLAAEWASELQPSYAPELHFEGTALGGLTPNITSVLETVHSGIFVGLAFAGITGLAKAYPNLTSYLDVHMVPSMRAAFEYKSSGCLIQSILGDATEEVYSYLDTGAGILTDEVPASVLAYGAQMGVHGVPTMPMFFYQAVGDDISPVKNTDELYNTLCSKGATIEYNRDLVGEHITEVFLGSTDAIDWISDRLNGLPVSNQGTCIQKDVVLNAVDAGTGSALGGDFVALLQQLLGGRLGPLGLEFSG